MASVSPLTSIGYAKVGSQNPIEIPIISIDHFRETLGSLIAQGDCCQIRKVKGAEGKRVYKVIPFKNFTNGDEIRISEIASNLGVAPQFHQAFSFKSNHAQYVVIEMDYGGRSLGQHMEDVGSKIMASQTDFEEERDPLAHLPQEVRELVKKMQANDRYQTIEVKRSHKASIQETLKKIYSGAPETFYFQLFLRIKTLAEAKISYRDTHAGNIIPNPQEENGLKLIDFDKASLEVSVADAKAKSLSHYTTIFLKQFEALPDLSPESQKLISWWRSDSFSM